MKDGSTFSHKPPLPRKGGIPLSTEIPAPVKIIVRADFRKIDAALSKFCIFFLIFCIFSLFFSIKIHAHGVYCNRKTGKNSGELKNDETA